MESIQKPPSIPSNSQALHHQPIIVQLSRSNLSQNTFHRGGGKGGNRAHTKQAQMTSIFRLFCFRSVGETTTVSSTFASTSSTTFLSKSHGFLALFLLLTLLMTIQILLVELILNHESITDSIRRTTFDSSPSSSSSSFDSSSSFHSTSLSRVFRGTHPLQPISETFHLLGVNLTQTLQDNIPPIEHVVQMYGSEAILVGLETCETFRKSIPNEDAYLGPAGMFNTGTNFVEMLLGANCYLPDKVAKKGNSSTGMRMQVPWGKHSPVSWRGKHIAETGGNIIQTHVLPIVTIKDPYTWMDSMCRHPYEANFIHQQGHCPNLIPLTPREKEKAQANHWTSLPVTINYPGKNVTHHSSFAGLWNDWYSAWLDVDFPRVLVRYEDLLHHTKEVIETVCTCGGGKMRPTFQYIEESAKVGDAHAGSNGFVKAILKYSNATKRVANFHELDLDYAKKTLRSDIMELFHYTSPP